MKLSVIISTYNRADMTVQAVQSVFSQTHVPNQVIVVDDGSTDTTREKMREFGDRISYVFQPNSGISAARNAGIQMAQHDWLAFLDSDDLWKPNKLEKQIQALEKNAQYKCCYTGEEWQRHGTIIQQKAHQQKYSGNIYTHCLPLCIISASSILLHRSILQDVGVFDTNLPACEDYDLWLRLTCCYPVLLVKEKLIIKRAGNWPQLSQQMGLDKYRIIALQKMLTSNRLDSNQRQQTTETLENKIKIYTTGCRKHGRIQEAEWAANILKECGEM